MRLERTDVIILGAGAAGMMCAIEAGKRGRRVIVLDHARAPGEKIRISGGGRCNFTNIHAGPKNFLSANPHFCKSALARYTPRDFLDLVERHGIAWHEKTLGQLFCDNSAKDIIAMLLAEMRAVGVDLRLSATVGTVEHDGDAFRVTTDGGTLTAPSLVVATGGKSIPKMGATGLAYRIAEQFGLGIVETRPGLVPLTLDPARLAANADLPGVAVEVVASHGKTAFREAMLFTHRGLSGPAILQISSYWRAGKPLVIDLLPGTDLEQQLIGIREGRIAVESGDGQRQQLSTVLGGILPRRLAVAWLAAARPEGLAYLTGQERLAEIGNATLRALAQGINRWQVMPAGTEGYKKAEVTLGGISTRELDPRNLQVLRVPGLHCIGEAVDVTGWLGGYNFQWAWASAYAAATAMTSAP